MGPWIWPGNIDILCCLHLHLSAMPATFCAAVVATLFDNSRQRNVYKAIEFLNFNFQTYGGQLR